jgi:hypothetical protein
MSNPMAMIHLGGSAIWGRGHSPQKILKISSQIGGNAFGHSDTTFFFFLSLGDIFW